MLGPILQRAGINFLDIQARHHAGRVYVRFARFQTEEDLLAFQKWCAKGLALEEDGADIRVATAEEIKKHEETAW